MGTSNTSWVALVLAKDIFPSPGAAWGHCVAPTGTAGWSEEEGWLPPQAAVCRCFPAREEQRGRSLKGRGKIVAGPEEKLLLKETQLSGAVCSNVG